MPARLIEHQQQLFVGSQLLLLSESRQSQLKSLDIDAGPQQAAAAPAGGLPKAIPLHPLIALLDDCRHLAAFFAPHPPQDGCEANAMLIAPPQLHLRLRLELT